MSYGDSPKPAAYDTAFDRDRALESRYSFPREPDVSVLQYVSQRQVELTQEFRDWRARNQLGNESILDGLVRWEEERFGDKLFEAAHRLLWFRIRSVMVPSQAQPPPPRRPELPEGERLRRFDEALGKLAEKKAVPA
jgi:hypothetical protein